MHSIALLGLAAAAACVDARMIGQARSVATTGNSTALNAHNTFSGTTIGTSTTHLTTVKPTSVKPTSVKSTSVKPSTTSKKPSAISSFVPPSGSPFAMRLACGAGNIGCSENWSSQNFLYTEYNPFSVLDNSSKDKYVWPYLTDSLWVNSVQSAAQSWWVIDSKTNHLEPYNFAHSAWYGQEKGHVHPQGYFAHFNPKASPSRLLFANQTIAAKNGLQPVTCSYTTDNAKRWPTNSINCKGPDGTALKTLLCDTVGGESVSWSQGLFLGKSAPKGCHEMQLVQLPVYEGTAYCGSACDANGTSY